ncbi:MAG: hypothetical protein AB7O56_09610 [Bauldia sp.]
MVVELLGRMRGNGRIFTVGGDSPATYALAFARESGKVRGLGKIECPYDLIRSALAANEPITLSTAAGRLMQLTIVAAGETGTHKVRVTILHRREMFNRVA